MNALPADVRVIGPGDVEEVVRVCLEGAREGATIGTMDPEAVREWMRKAAWGEDGVVVACSPAQGEIGGIVGLRAAKMWYGADDSWFWTDLGIYVRPAWRKSLVALRLMRFVQWWVRDTEMPCYFNILPHVDFEGKVKLFSRFGKHVGATFLIGG